MKRLLLLLPLLITACSMQPDPERGVAVDYNLPFEKKNWTVQEYEDANTDFCVVSPGYGGLKVIVRKDKHSATITQAVKSTRGTFSPGMHFRVSVNGHVYRSNEEFMPLSQSDALVADLRQGDKAYLEWREPSPTKLKRWDRQTTIIPLAEFDARYQECVTGLKGK